MRTSGRSIVIFAMPASARRTSRSGCPCTRRRRPALAAGSRSVRHGAKASLCGHGGRGMAASRRGARARRAPRSRRPTGSCSYARAARRRASPAPASSPRAASRPGAARRDRAAAGLAFAAGAARLPAARRGRGAGRPAPRGGRARARSRTGAARRGRASRCAASAGAPAPRGGAGRATTSTRRAVVIHTSGTTSAPTAGRADLRQPPVERARLGRRARPRPERALAVRAAALPRRRPLDPRALARSTPRRRSCTSASRPTACCTRCASSRSRSSASSPRRSRGCSTPACERPPALRCALTGGGPVPAALLERAREAGVPVSLDLRPHRGLLAGRRRTPRRPRSADRRARAPGRRCSARACASPPDGEILVAGPTVAPARSRRDGWLHTGDLGALDERGAPARHRAQGRHDRQRRRERRAGRGRGGARGPPRRARGGRARPPGRAVGRGGHGDRRAAPGREPSTARSCARTAPRALAPYKVPKQLALAAEPLPRTRSGKLLRRELAMSFDAERPHRDARASQGWEEAAAGLGPPPGADARARRARLALDARRDRAAARPARARAGRRPRRDGAARGRARRAGRAA